MADIHDIARIGYIIENYDKIIVGNELSEEFKNSDGTPSKTILLQKNIGEEYYYIVEAVPDSGSKTLFVVSAFINKNDTYYEKHNKNYEKALNITQNVNHNIENSIHKIPFTCACYPGINLRRHSHGKYLGIRITEPSPSYRRL